MLQIGKTKVFLRAGQMAELDARRIEVLANAARLIQRQIRTYLTRKEFIAMRKATIHMQKLWRGFSFPFIYYTPCLKCNCLIGKLTFSLYISQPNLHVSFMKI